MNLNSWSLKHNENTAIYHHQLSTTRRQRRVTDSKYRFADEAPTSSSPSTATTASTTKITLSAHDDTLDNTDEAVQNKYPDYCRTITITGETIDCF